MQQRINARLLQLYQSHQAGIDKIYAKEKNGEAYLDGPHLIHCWEESYSRSWYRIFVLGQENYGWMGPSADIDGQIKVLLKGR